VVLGHGDLHVEHVRISGDRVVAMYDWDVLVRAPEPFVTGRAVGGFTADWSIDEPAVVPRASEVLDFVRDYERARGSSFTAPQRGTILAHWVEMTAYAARLEQAKRDAGLPHRPTYEHRLREHGPELLDDGG
jgi:hypothetical protein